MQARADYYALPPVPGSRLRAAGGAVLGLGLFLSLGPLATQGINYLAWVLSGHPESFDGFNAAAIRFEQPVGMLAANLGIIMLIPLTGLLLLTVHYARPVWVLSVTSSVRGRYFGRMLKLAAVIFGGSTLVLALAQGIGLNVSAAVVPYLAIIVLTSPLQAAAEEIFFRGYLGQALTTLLEHPLLGVAGTSLIFAFLHGGQNPALFVNRLVFGLIAGLLVLATGGLEAGVAAHIANNLTAYGAAALTGTIVATRTVSEISWSASGLQILTFSVFAAGAWLVARRSATPMLARVTRT